MNVIIENKFDQSVNILRVRLHREGIKTIDTSSDGKPQIYIIGVSTNVLEIIKKIAWDVETDNGDAPFSITTQ